MYYAVNVYSNGKLIETIALLDSQRKANRVAERIRAQLPGRDLVVERCRIAKHW